MSKFAYSTVQPLKCYGRMAISQWTFVVVGHLFAVASLQVVIQTQSRNVDLSVWEPPVEWCIAPVKNLLGCLIPSDIFGLISPE